MYTTNYVMYLNFTQYMNRSCRKLVSLLPLKRKVYMVCAVIHVWYLNFKYRTSGCMCRLHDHCIQFTLPCPLCSFYIVHKERPYSSSLFHCPVVTLTCTKLVNPKVLICTTFKFTNIQWESNSFMTYTHMHVLTSGGFSSRSIGLSFPLLVA